MARTGKFITLEGGREQGSPPRLADSPRAWPSRGFPCLSRANPAGRRAPSVSGGFSSATGLGPGRGGDAPFRGAAGTSRAHNPSLPRRRRLGDQRPLRGFDARLPGRAGAGAGGLGRAGPPRPAGLRAGPHPHARPAVDEGMRRAAARSGADRYERMGAEFHEKVRAGSSASRPGNRGAAPSSTPAAIPMRSRRRSPASRASASARRHDPERAPPSPGLSRRGKGISPGRPSFLAPGA